MLAAGQPLVWRSSLFSCGGVFILCIKLWRYFHLVRSPILTLWGRGQFKSLLLQPSHSRLMRKPTKKEEEGGRKSERKSRRFRRPLLVRLPMSADRHRGRAAQRVQSSIVQTLQLSFPGSPPRSCCVQSQDGTDGSHLPWEEGARPFKWLVLLEVPGLRAGMRAETIVKLNDLYR